MKKYSNPRVVNDIGGIVVFDEDAGGERHLDPGTEDHARAMAEEFGPVEPYQPESPRDPRLSAVMPRVDLCKSLARAGILSAGDAALAAQGGWPSAFADCVAGMSSDEAADLQIDWAAATQLRYGDPLLQRLALAHAEGDQASATATLDAIFGID